MGVTSGGELTVAKDGFQTATYYRAHFKANDIAETMARRLFPENTHRDAALAAVVAVASKVSTQEGGLRLVEREMGPPIRTKSENRVGQFVRPNRLVQCAACMHACMHSPASYYPK